MSNATYKVAGVMGWPVAQSRSPKLHGYWLDKYKIPGSYILLPVQPENLADAIKGLRAFGFAGWPIWIQTSVRCPLLALSGQSDRTRLCPLSE